MEGMIAYLDGNRVAISALWWPSMNFGQFRWSAPTGRYVLAVPREDLIARLDRPYVQCVSELRADDATVSDQLACPLREAGYPRFSELLDCPAALLDSIKAYLCEDLLKAFLPYQPAERPRFMVNSIDAAEIASDFVRFSGRGYYGAPGFANDLDG